MSGARVERGSAGQAQNSVTFITHNFHRILILFKTCLNACQSHTMRAGRRVFSYAEDAEATICFRRVLP